MLDAADFRRQFPFFAEHPGITYLDNAATTQKPRQVLDAVQRALLSSANPGRGSHDLARAAEATVEQARTDVAALINAQPADVILTMGATASLNLIAQAWGSANLRTGDEIVVAATDHNASVEPWLRVAARCGVVVKTIRHDPFGVVTPKAVTAVLSSRTRLVAVTHVHNVYGGLTDIASIRAVLPPGVKLSVDAAQSVGHLSVDVAALGADFLAFSGHKMFAAPGSGVLWVRERGELTPVTFGGGDHPFEPGTPNVAAAASLGAASRLIQDVGVDNIAARTELLTAELIAGLRGVSTVEFLAGPAQQKRETAYGVVSFRMDGVRLDDAAAALDSSGIAARVGSHCSAEPGEDIDSVRLSLHAYNTSSEVARAVEVIDQLAP